MSRPSCSGLTNGDAVVVDNGREATCADEGTNRTVVLLLAVFPQEGDQSQSQSRGGEDATDERQPHR